jgi:hypothetical protein
MFHRRARFSLVVLVAVALPLACGSSSNQGSPSGDGGSDASNVLSPVSDGGGTPTLNAMCGQLAAAGGGMATACPAGQTCCTMISLTSISFSATCVAAGQCSGGISNECQTEMDCTGGQVCCGGVATGDAAPSEAGAAGPFGGFNLAALSTNCQASCEPGQAQQCASTTACPSGQTCQAAGGGAFAGFGGDGGFPGLGGLPGTDGGDGGGFQLPMFCSAADAGTPPFDSGASPDTGQEASAGDGSTE